MPHKLAYYYYHLCVNSYHSNSVVVEVTEILPFGCCFLDLLGTVVGSIGPAGGGWIGLYIHPKVWLTLALQPLLVHLLRFRYGEVLLWKSHGEGELCSLVPHQEGVFGVFHHMTGHGNGTFNSPEASHGTCVACCAGRQSNDDLDDS